MGKENDFELVKVKYFGNVQEEFVWIMFGVILGNFMQDFIGLVGEPGFYELPI